MRALFLSLSLLTAVISTTVFAHDDKPQNSIADAINEALAKAYEHNRDIEICSAMLGLTVSEVRPDGSVVWNIENAVGPRGLLAMAPGPDLKSATNAKHQGAYFWGQSISVQPSIEAARKHDLKFNGLGQVMYFISPIDVSDLQDTTNLPADFPKDELERRREIVRARYHRVFVEGKAPFIYFTDRAEDLFHERKLDEKRQMRVYRRGTNELAPRDMHTIDHDLAKRLMPTDRQEFFTNDDRGARFSQSGYVFPPIRGMVLYSEMFERNKDGYIASQTIKRAVNRINAKLQAGTTFSFNVNFEEALQKAISQTHNQTATTQGVSNSRYQEREVQDAEREKYAAGVAFSFEERDANGKLGSGLIGMIGAGKLVSADTVLYDRSIDEAKESAVALVYLLNQMGISGLDAQSVTAFTASLKGKYVPAEEFLRRVFSEGREPVKLNYGLKLSKDNMIPARILPGQQ